MAEEYGPYHRTGEPGGPGCAVSSIPISVVASDGSHASAYLLDAGRGSELEMLRTIAQGFGVRWGHDELGWWATIPNRAL